MIKLWWNGCGWEWWKIRPPHSKFFYNVCLKHDNDYEKWWTLKDKLKADLVFLINLIKCSFIKWKYRFPFLLIWAFIYYIAVSIWWFKYFNFKTNEFYSWMIWIWEKETDWKFWADINIINLLRERGSLWRWVKYEYNQSAQYKTRNWCTIYSAITEVSYLMDYKFSLCQIYEIGDKMIKDWKLDPNKWAYLSDAVDYTRRWWNENFPEEKIESYQISYRDLELRKVLTHEVVRLTQIWYRTSLELYRDLQENWVATKKDYPKDGWHAVSQYWLNTIDNYKWKLKFNRYSFQYLQDLISNGVIYPNWYLFLKSK